MGVVCCREAHDVRRLAYRTPCERQGLAGRVRDLSGEPLHLGVQLAGRQHSVDQPERLGR